MSRVVMRVAGWLNGRKTTVAAMSLVAAIVYLPMFPFQPRCFSGNPDTVDVSRLFSGYRVELTERLGYFGVPYIVIGDVVLLRFSDWLDDPGDWVLNASNKAVLTLTDRRFNPRLEGPPDHVKAMAEAARNPRTGFIDLDCELVRAVAIEGW